MHCSFGVGSTLRNPTGTPQQEDSRLENDHKNVGPWVLGTLSFHHSHVTFFFSLPNEFFFKWTCLIFQIAVSTGRMTIKPMGFVFPLSTTIVCLIKHEQFHLDPKNQLVCFAN